MNSTVRYLLLCRLCLCVCISAFAADASTPSASGVATVENLYADLNDAASIVATIDSGLFKTYQGKDRADWQALYLARRKEVASRLANLPTQALSKEDARAVIVMKKAIASMPEGSPSSLESTGHCKDAQQSALDYAALRHVLYACFDEYGNNVEFEGKKLTRVSALEMLGRLDDANRRKQLFLAFNPLWQSINGNDEAASPYRRMIAMAAADVAKNGSPMDTAAQTIGAQSTEVEKWLEQILDAWRESTSDAMVEPWDFRYQVGAADRELASAIPRASLIPINERYYHDLGADLKQLGILYDLDPRPGKAPLAYSDFVTHGRWVGGVWQPTIARVSANYDGGGLGLLNELVHENGHAVHMAALRTRPAFMDLGDPVFFEAFADVTSWDTFEPAWQQRYLGRSAAESESLKSLFSGVVSDVAWALFELRMLRTPSADPNAVWTDITSHYLRIVPHPELSWWLVRVQLVDSPGYMVNYGLGSVVTADIRQRERQAIGTTATGNPKWYAWTSENLLKPGEEQETSALLKQFLGRPVSAQPLLEQIHRVAPPKSRAVRPSISQTVFPAIARPVDRPYTAPFASMTGDGVGYTTLVIIRRILQ